MLFNISSIYLFIYLFKVLKNNIQPSNHKQLVSRWHLLWKTSSELEYFIFYHLLISFIVIFLFIDSSRSQPQQFVDLWRGSAIWGSTATGRASCVPLMLRSTMVTNAPTEGYCTIVLFGCFVDFSSYFSSSITSAIHQAFNVVVSFMSSSRGMIHHSFLFIHCMIHHSSSAWYMFYPMYHTSFILIYDTPFIQCIIHHSSHEWYIIHPIYHAWSIHSIICQCSLFSKNSWFHGFKTNSNKKNLFEDSWWGIQWFLKPRVDKV